MSHTHRCRTGVPPLQDSRGEVEHTIADSMSHWRTHSARLAAFCHPIVHRIASRNASPILARVPYLVNCNIVAIAVDNRHIRPVFPNKHAIALNLTLSVRLVEMTLYLYLRNVTKTEKDFRVLTASDRTVLGQAPGAEPRARRVGQLATEKRGCSQRSQPG
jgi:hypothetical protein